MEYHFRKVKKVKGVLDSTDDLLLSDNTIRVTRRGLARISATLSGNKIKVSLETDPAADAIRIGRPIDGEDYFEFTQHSRNSFHMRTPLEVRELLRDSVMGGGLYLPIAGVRGAYSNSKDSRLFKEELPPSESKIEVQVGDLVAWLVRPRGLLGCREARGEVLDIVEGDSHRYTKGIAVQVELEEESYYLYPTHKSICVSLSRVRVVIPSLA